MLLHSVILMTRSRYYGGQHFMAAAAAGVLNSYADGVNVHSDGLSNQPKRGHLAQLHALLLAHADTIMGTRRPIPRRALTENEAELSAFVFGEGDLVFLENAHGKPGGDTRESRTASLEHSAGNCSFPINASSVRYKGLSAAAASITREDECAAACCAIGSAAHCNVYQFYEVKSPGQASQCWIGSPTHAEGSPPQGFHSRARVEPPVGPAPPGPTPSGHTTVQWNGRSYPLCTISMQTERILKIGLTGILTDCEKVFFTWY